MKKLIVLLSIISLFVTGCTVLKVSNNIDGIVSSVMREDMGKYNVYFEGYKYYVPKGLKFINKEEYNATIRDRFNNKYYLYVDAISYHHKVNINYKENNLIYYSKVLKYNDKNGYLDIEVVNGKYYVQYMYNYAKIEVYTSENHLYDVICNCSTILKSVKYNDKVINSLIGDNQLEYKDEVYSLFKNKVKKDNFLNYEEEYDSGKKKNNDIDDDHIDIESDIES